MTGLFVTFEGGEGSGKSTQLARLAERLARDGHAPLVTREPGGSALGERVRALLLDEADVPVARAELLLLAASRAQLVETVIRPALEAGRVVLCDRYTDSTLAYQAAGRALPEAQAREVNAFATGGLVPDLTLLFDLPVGEGLARRSRAPGATNRLDREPPEFHERVRGAYRELARREPDRIVVIDAARPESDVAQAVWAALAPRLAQAGITAARGS